MSQEISQPQQTPSKPVANPNNSLPTMEQILANQETPEQQTQEPAQQEPAQQEPTQQEPKPDQWAELTAQQRELYKSKKEVSDLKAEVERLKQENETKYGNIENIVNDFMGTSEVDPDNQPGSPNFDPVKYEEELTKKIMEKVQGHTQQTEEQKQMEESVNTFKSEIKSFLDENGQNYPLASSMGHNELVFEIIEQQYQKDAGEYGHEYAAKNMLSNEQAAQMAEKHLASEIEKVLQSTHMRDYLLTQINQIRAQDPQRGVENQSSQVNQSNHNQTLTNNMGQTTTQNQHVDETAMTDDEAFKRALALVK